MTSVDECSNNDATVAGTWYNKAFVYTGEFCPRVHFRRKFTLTFW